MCHPGALRKMMIPKLLQQKWGSALGLGMSFHMKRSAFEVYDFAQDAIRLKELAGTPDEFADLFGPFWDKDASLGGGDLWRQTKRLREMAEASSELAVLPSPRQAETSKGVMRLSGDLYASPQATKKFPPRGSHQHRARRNSLFRARG
jgi:hypothetical protein